MKNWQIALLAMGSLGVIFTILWFAMSQDKYAKHMSIQTDKPVKTKTVVNQTARKFKHVLKRDHNKNLKEKVLSDWKITWCSPDTHSKGEFGSCDKAAFPKKTIYVSKRDGWTDRLRHEVFHALLHEKLDADHHNWLGKHGWCYGAKNCADAWNPNLD